MFLSLFVAVFIIAVNGAYGAVFCHPSFCDNVDCEDEAVIRSQCQDGRIQPGGSVCGCCPICINFLDEAERCRPEFPMPGPGVITHECREGLFCNSAGICQRTCTSIYEEATSDQFLVGQFVPRCTEDGRYEAVQCRGSGCYCVNEDGQKLFSTYRMPYADHIAYSNRMNCDCARAGHSVCAPNGNYLYV